MTTRFQVTFDCADPDRLTRFWATALGYVVEDPPEGFDTWGAYWRDRGIPEEELDDDVTSDSLVDPEGVGPRIWFQKVPEPKVIKNRVHLDLAVGGGRGAPLDARKRRVDAEVERLTAAGATTLRVLRPNGADYYAVVLEDPEGNEFCIS